MTTIHLPAGTKHIPFDDLAELMADALYPCTGEDDERWGYQCAQINLKTELKRAVDSGVLPVKDRLTLGPHPYPVGNALKRALVSVNDLRAFVADREIEVITAPAKDTETPAPVATVSDGPAPLTTSDIAYCFAGLHWDESGWKKPLGDKPKWLAGCVAIRGQQGVSETRWNPVLIGAALVQQGHATARNVRAKFQTVDLLSPWLDAWKTYEADNLDNE